MGGRHNCRDVRGECGWQTEWQRCEGGSVGGRQTGRGVREGVWVADRMAEM